ETLALESLRLAFSDLRISLVIGLIPASLLVIGLWPFVEHERILLWFVYFLMISIIRYIFLLRFQKQDRPDVKTWQAYFVFTAALGGSAWGLCGTWLMPTDWNLQVLLLFCVGGVVFFAARSMAPVSLAFVAFMGMALLPAAILYLLEADRIHAIASLMIMGYCLGLAMLSLKFTEEFHTILKLRTENAELVDSLQRENSKHKFHAQVVDEENRILEQVLCDTPRDVVLEELNHAIEDLLPGSISSILTLDEDTHTLHVASAPNLPKTYNEAVEGLQIGPQAGSCGTAAYRNETVIVSDIATDPLWQDYSEQVIRQFGLKACWSTPIHGRDGRVLGTFAVYFREVREPDEEELSVLKALANVTGMAIERWEMQNELEFLAHYDKLTGLPNRALLKERLEFAEALCKRRRTPFTLLFIDLDGFKKINDEHGHEAGDRVLEAIGGRLRRNLRRIDTASRFGGDEFIVLLADTDNRNDIQQVAEKLMREIRKPIEFREQRFRIGASVGVARFPRDSTNTEQLIRRADAAMYEAKRAGRNRIAFYGESQQSDSQSLQDSV
ncbi:MAG: diguanylate cyclase, partial [Zetaproteobacteria bacterium]